MLFNILTILLLSVTAFKSLLDSFDLQNNRLICAADPNEHASEDTLSAPKSLEAAVSTSITVGLTSSWSVLSPALFLLSGPQTGTREAYGFFLNSCLLQTATSSGNEFGYRESFKGSGLTF